MKKAPVYPNFDNSDYVGNFEFDPQVDFNQFLEEARQHARQMNLQNNSLQQEELEKRKTAEDKKGKKSWKNTLIKWWKSDNKTSKESANGSAISKPRKGHVSGPVYGISGASVEKKHRRQTSGPIGNLLNYTKRTGHEIPYMCLDQLNDSSAVKDYGPVYLVT